jgi:hypothetical protein
MCRNSSQFVDQRWPVRNQAPHSLRFWIVPCNKISTAVPVLGTVLSMREIQQPCLTEENGSIAATRSGIFAAMVS